MTPAVWYDTVNNATLFFQIYECTPALYRIQMIFFSSNRKSEREKEKARERERERERERQKETEWYKTDGNGTGG